MFEAVKIYVLVTHWMKHVSDNAVLFIKTHTVLYIYANGTAT